MTRLLPVIAGFAFTCLVVSSAYASMTVFFDSSQVATPVESGVTWDTIRSNGYLFTYTRDKLFTGGTGTSSAAKFAFPGRREWRPRP